MRLSIIGLMGLMLSLSLPWHVAATTGPVPLSTFALPVAVAGTPHYFVGEGGAAPFPPADSYFPATDVTQVGTYDYGVIPNVPAGHKHVQGHYDVTIYRTTAYARQADLKTRNVTDLDESGRAAPLLPISHPVANNEWLRVIHGSHGPGQVYCVAVGGTRYQNVRIEAVLFNYEAPVSAAPCAADNAWAVRVLASEYQRIVAFVAAHPTAQIPVTPTTVRVYDPYTAQGYIKRGMTLGRVVTGTCTSASYVTARTDAYRCLAGSNIMDPCFRPPTRDNGFVVCVGDP